MPEIVTCPRCGRKLRIPDAMLGKKAQCPSCGLKLQASRADSEEDVPEAIPVAIAANPKPIREGPSLDFDEEDRGPRRRKRSSRAAGTGSNTAALTALSIVLTVLVLCAGGIRVIVLIERWSKGRAKEPAKIVDSDPHAGTVVFGMPASAPLPPELKDNGGIDLISLVDPHKDFVGGHWLLTDNTLHCNDKHFVPRVQLPYIPPEEYDFIVTFAQKEVRNGVSLMMPNGKGGTFYWFLGGEDGANYGFQTGPPRRELKAGLIKPGIIYTTRVEVRKKGLRGFLDGKELMHLEADIASLKGDMIWRDIPDPRCLAVTCDDPTVFYYVRVIEVTGHGAQTR